MIENEKICTTIVIPTFNRANLLRQAVDSALFQSVKCDVVVVDHGSTDHTPAVAQGYGGAVTYVRREVDRGPIFAWLDGVMTAQTEFVKILFDDDFIEPSFVEEAQSLMGPSVGFVFSVARVLDLGSQTVNHTLFTYAKPSGVYKCNSRFGRSVESEMISPSALLARKADVVDALYQGKLPFQSSEYHGAGADHFVKLLQMLRYRQFGYLDQPLVTFGSHPGSITIAAFQEDPAATALRSTYSEVRTHYTLLKKIRGFHRAMGSLEVAILFVKRLRNLMRSALDNFRSSARTLTDAWRKH